PALHRTRMKKWIATLSEEQRRTLISLVDPDLSYMLVCMHHRQRRDGDGFFYEVRFLSSTRFKILLMLCCRPGKGRWLPFLSEILQRTRGPSRLPQVVRQCHLPVQRALRRRLEERLAALHRLRPPLWSLNRFGISSMTISLLRSDRP